MKAHVLGGKEKVQYEAPAAPLLENATYAFIASANDTKDKTDLVLRAGLARSDDSAQRCYSMSAQVGLERND